MSTTGLGWIDDAVRLGWKVAKPFVSTPQARFMTAGLIGASIAYNASSDLSSETQKSKNMMAGLGLGLTAGALMNKSALKIMANIAGKAGNAAMRVAPRVALNTANRAVNIANFVNKNSLTALGIGLVGYGLYQNIATGRSRDNLESRQMMAQEMGSNWAPGMGGSRNYTNTSLTSSTNGLTLGLHSSRHR